LLDALPVFFFFASTVPLPQYNHLSMFIVGEFQFETAADLRLHTLTLGVQMKTWQQHYIFLPELGRPTSQVFTTRS
jgi:hypothetical protein